MSHGAAILAFLTDHRGQGFCARCIGTKLGLTGNLDVTMRHLEGSGVERRYAPCAACAQHRLVARAH